jgi:hypothetical protein
MLDFLNLGRCKRGLRIVYIDMLTTRSSQHQIFPAFDANVSRNPKRLRLNNISSRTPENSTA